ncbi:hypothetical protein GLOIN_2v1772788 [Rhizophagus irregularis DAOM 181602=DAOM 197198]|nr:hypothetical protein GLOIN_2v1772788 [Rhizophagus irregularis DAOM 181602=DAOM 197198]
MLVPLILIEKTISLFDETLETLGDRINLFLIEFLDDNVAHQGDRAVKSRKEITWNVINQLIIAFDNLMDNSLFEDISELSNMTAEYTFEGRNRLFNFVIQ